MLSVFALIKQLSPWITEVGYAEMLDHMLANGYKQAVAFQEGLPIAVCGYWINTKLYAGKYVGLDNVVVHEACRSGGVGKILCDYVLELAQQEGCVSAMLDAYLPNEKAHPFYERQGFKKIGYHFMKKFNS